jgi:hypothetical protein
MLRGLRRGTALTRAQKKELGPVQIVVVGFDDIHFQDAVLPALRRLRDLEIVRLADMVVVAKSVNGDLTMVQANDLTQKQSAQLDGMAAALVGIGVAAERLEAGAGGYLGDEQTWSVADAIPAGTMAVVALLEHRWAIPVRDAVERGGGTTLADAWVHPDDLAFYEGVAAAQRAEQERRK